MNIGRFFCPCCGQTHSGFKAGGSKSRILAELQVVGGGYRTGRKCPICSCFDRERLVYLFLASLETIFKNKLILHIAPERHVRILLECDNPSGYFSGSLRFRPNTPRMDITKISHDSNYFDLIVCNHVLEHIQDDRTAMGELYRVLKPGGLAILQVPISSKIKDSYEDSQMNTAELRLQAFGQRDHVRIYAKDDYVARLESKGFVVEMLDFSQTKGLSFAMRHGINSEEELYLGRKSNNS
jgi:SAM-dependent methyltransferase